MVVDNYYRQNYESVWHLLALYFGLLMAYLLYQKSLRKNFAGFGVFLLTLSITLPVLLFIATITGIVYMGMCDVRDKLLVVGFVVAINFLMYVVSRMIYKAPVVVSTLKDARRLHGPR